MRVLFRVTLVALGVAAMASCRSAPPESDSSVPTDIETAVAKLRHMLPEETLAEMREGDEDSMCIYHLGLGMWVRNNWGLWRGGPLADYFNDMGVEHPDDMSGIILTSLWRQLHDQPLRVNEQVAYYKEYWRQATEPGGAKCPEHGAPLSYESSRWQAFGEPGKPDICVHQFRCSAHSERWFWQVDKGYYRAGGIEVPKE